MINAIPHREVPHWSPSSLIDQWPGSPDSGYVAWCLYHVCFLSIYYSHPGVDRIWNVQRKQITKMGICAWDSHILFYLLQDVYTNCIYTCMSSELSCHICIVHTVYWWVEDMFCRIASRFMDHTIPRAIVPLTVSTCTINPFVNP